MNVKTENVGKNKVKLEIEIEPEILEEGLDKSYKKNAKRFNVPGFRKGRAPRMMVERYFGVEALYEDAVDFLFKEYYPKALDESKIEPVDSPELDLVDLERGKPFVFTATVTVKPEVKLGRYIGVEAPYKTVLVTDEDIERELAASANSHARLIPIEDRASLEGDTLLIDYEGYVDDIPFEGGKAEGYNLEIGSKTFIGGFEEQLVGRLPGDDFKVNVRFPDEYRDEHVRGKDAVFNVKVHSVKKKELPAIDDDFAQDVSEFDSLDEFKADIRKQLTERQSYQADNDFQDAVLRKIADESEIDIPEVMIERQIEQNKKEFEMSLAYQGLDLERYFELTSTTEAQLEGSLRERSAYEVRMRLIVEQIARQESLETTDEEYEEEVKKRAEGGRKTVEEYKKQVTPEYESYIRSGLKTDKTIAFVTSNAKRV